MIEKLPPCPEGHTLPQPFYVDPEIFRRDIQLLGDTQWLMVDHASRIPQPGDYFLFRFGSEELIIIRDRSGEVRGHYNVCRHRGSRVLLEPEGHVNAMSCPYHGWTYELSGSLRAAQHMPEGFCREENGLAPVRVRVRDGLIFVNSNKGTPPDFDEFIKRAEPVLQLQNLAEAKVAARRSIPTAANWKLLVENFLECYHCNRSHPLVRAIHDKNKLLAFGAGAGSGDDLMAPFSPAFEQWVCEEGAQGGYTDQYADTGHNFQSFGRIMIGRGNQTESADGKPVAPTMIRSGRYDGAQIYMTFNPLSTLLANCDYAVIFRFTPRGPQLSDAEAIYLVRKDAQPGRDYDEERLVKFWEVTMREDKKITEDNQSGVNSAVYRPGRYSKQEQRISDFTRWYLRHLGVLQQCGADGSQTSQRR